ncbi:MAG: F0F1 ATP synthase subunit epsilon [Candidatus Cryptobacteroides sp.]|nr:F0F1 ATP synthase subunit epsilon [Rikenellaceae bacterium]MDY5746252.1 F0F1 ATP synthase subunit epsilon [Candidatus Cryptobacteroides sp.]
MQNQRLTLTILSPEETLFDAEVLKVFLPGGEGPFELLPGHAPLISVLVPGVISWETAEGKGELRVSRGIVRVDEGKITVCAEI